MQLQSTSIPKARLPLCEQFPVIETRRMVLRLPRPSDKDVVARYWTSPRSRPNDGPKDVEHAQQMIWREALVWYFEGHGLWIGVERKTHRLVLGASIYPLKDDENIGQLGWDLYDPIHGGWGYATEAVEALINYGRESLGYHGFQASMYADNSRSRRLAEKLGGKFLRSYERNGAEAVTYQFGARPS